jgi:hypothetical protein
MVQWQTVFNTAWKLRVLWARERQFIDQLEDFLRRVLLQGVTSRITGYEYMNVPLSE